MRIYLEGPDIVDFDTTCAIQQWFLIEVRKRRPDTVKSLNHDQAQKLVVEMVEESEEDTFSTWKMRFKLWDAKFY